jgi:hypothetical protein
MKSSMMRESFQPVPRRIADSIIWGGTDVQGICHNQGAAHPQAMETSDEPDDQGGEKIKHKE